MTDEPTIQPALTPAQWREALSVPPGIAWGFGQATEGTASCHAIAAMCLYGQPFGFTPEDVAVIRWLADYVALDHTTGYHITAGRVVAAKIAALLPPASP